ncbi:MAG: hypothetical protein ACQETL_08480 [Bacteroidota bacterium]
MVDSRLRFGLNYGKYWKEGRDEVRSWKKEVGSRLDDGCRMMGDGWVSIPK